MFCIDYSYKTKASKVTDRIIDTYSAIYPYPISVIIAVCVYVKCIIVPFYKVVEMRRNDFVSANDVEWRIGSKELYNTMVKRLVEQTEAHVV